MSWTKEDKSFKTLINRRATNSGKAFYEEFGDFTVDIHAREVKAEDIPLSNPTQAVSNGVAQQYDLLPLVEDNTVASSQSWYAEVAGVRLANWISDKYGAPYALRLFDGNDQQIFPTDTSDWIFDYVTGILTFNGNVASYTKPFKITAYRYIGQYLIDSVNAGGDEYITDTYANIKTLKDNSQLKGGSWYLINDYRTIHQITNTNNINTGDLEPLAVFAVDNNSFAPEAVSPQYPTDILYYNFDDVLAEDGTTTRNGFITYRKDVVRKLEAYYDWRNVRNRLWNCTGVNAPALTNVNSSTFGASLFVNQSLDSYTEFYFNFPKNGHDANPRIRFTFIFSTSNFDLYKPDGSRFAANELDTYLSGTLALIYYSPKHNGFVVVDMFDENEEVKGLISFTGSNTIVGDGYDILVDGATFEDRRTFGDSKEGTNFNNISIGKYDAGLPNVTFYADAATANITIKDGSRNILFSEASSSVSIAEDSSNLIFKKAITNSKLNGKTTSLFSTKITDHFNSSGQISALTIVGDRLLLRHVTITDLFSNNTLRFNGGVSAHILFTNQVSFCFFNFGRINYAYFYGLMNSVSTEYSTVDFTSVVLYSDDILKVDHYSEPFLNKATFNMLAGYQTDLSASYNDRSFVDKGYVDQLVAGQLTTPRTVDIELTPNTTTGDGSSTGIALSRSPKAYIFILINGNKAPLGNGVKTKQCYFSGDGGTTARAYADIVAGDILYWNGVIANFELAADDVIDLLYI